MDILGIFAAVCSTAASIPQLCSESPQTLQLWSIVLRCTGGICWTVYGALKRDYPLMTASGVVATIEIMLCFRRRKALAQKLQTYNSPSQPHPPTSFSPESSKHTSCE